MSRFDGCDDDDGALGEDKGVTDPALEHAAAAAEAREGEEEGEVATQGAGMEGCKAGVSAGQILASIERDMQQQLQWLQPEANTVLTLLRTVRSIEGSSSNTVDFWSNLLWCLQAVVHNDPCAPEFVPEELRRRLKKVNHSPQPSGTDSSTDHSRATCTSQCLNPL